MKKLYKNFLTLVASMLLCGISYAQTQLVTDGGFEAGPGSTFWIEASTTFGTPICDLPNCGNGGGTGPRTGNYWAWFGGVSGNIETSSVTQSFVIPSGGTVTLQFWLEQVLCDGPQDFLDVKIDGNVVFNTDGGSTLCGVFGYSLQTIDISSYADGNSHTLSFNATTFSAIGAYTNFFVDDVSVIHSTGTGGNPCADTTSFAALNVAIPDDNATGISNVQTISGIPGTLGVDVKLQSVCFKIDHTWVGDLVVTLTAPNGVEITLTDRPGIPLTAGGCDGDNIEVCVDIGTGNEMETQCSNAPAIAGSFTAANGTNLDDINNAGGAANGFWQLFASDNAADDTGAIIEWSLVFDDGPVANWTSPGTYCATSGNINLNTLVTGTPGGIWSGNGVTGNTFNPTGLNGPVAITYTVANIGTGCSDSETNIINVVAGVPAAGFTVTPISLTCNFNNISVGGTSYLWNFGDSNISTDENPVHTYAATGTYQVTLTVMNSCGLSMFTQNVTVVNCPEGVDDGSFETGPGSGNWTETSTNFGTPVCDLVNCGNGGGTGPRTGTYWSHFGGVPQFEESSVSQSVTIPVNSAATLYFWLEIPICDSPSDFLKVAVDADTLYTVTGANNLCGNLGYQLQSINMDAYDDGLPHTVKFISKVYGLNSGSTSFFVDDISLIMCTGIGFAEKSLDQHISVMPVPATDFITINFNDITTTGIKIEILDMLGKNILNSEVEQVRINQSERIDVSGWLKGVYMVKVSNGNSTAVRKIVIQ